MAANPSQTLGNIGKAQPGTEKALVGLLVARIAMYFGVDWTEDQCVLCTLGILKNFDGLQVNEFKVFTERCETGFYKSQKNLTPALLMEWLYDFGKEVRAARDEVKNKYVPPTNPAPMEVVEQTFADITAMLMADREDEVPKHHFPSLEETIARMQANSRKAFIADGWTDAEIDEYVSRGIFPERFKNEER